MSFVFRLGFRTCASRTTMVKVACVFEDGETDVAFYAEILSEATRYWQARVLDGVRNCV